MIEGIRALNGYLNGSMTNELQEESEDDLGFIIMGLLFLFPIFFILYRVFKPSKPRCPQCKKKNTTMTKSNTLSKTKDYEVVKKIYTCQDCGHTFEKEEKINFPKDDGFNNTSGRVTPRRSSYNHTPRGGSFGGGSFGGGGAGSRF
jgi:uncharacterized protein